MTEFYRRWLFWSFPFLECLAFQGFFVDAAMCRWCRYFPLLVRRFVVVVVVPYQPRVAVVDGKPCSSPKLFSCAWKRGLLFPRSCRQKNKIQV